MKDIKGYEGIYAITSCGKVWSYRSNRFLHSYNRQGYQITQLNNNGRKETKTIHRLVAEAYIPNPNNLPHVDHIDGNKNHNYLNNLQWITQIDNTRKAKNRIVLQYDLDGNFIKEWPSSVIAAKELGLKCYCCIHDCCKGRQKTAYGYKWAYKD